MLPSSVKIFLCTEPQDRRRSFDALALVAQQHAQVDPQSGALFVFVGKDKRRLKVLWWDKNGFCLLYKRLHRAAFVLPSGDGAQRPSVAISAQDFAALIAGVEKHNQKCQKPLISKLH